MKSFYSSWHAEFGLPSSVIKRVLKYFLLEEAYTFCLTMTTKFYFITSAANLFCSIILICHAFNYWINYNDFNAIGIIQGIYCLIFSAFLIGFEVESIQNIYVVYFQFIKFPLGRGLTYLLFSLITLTTTWYGILSLILLIVLGVSSIFIHFLIPDSTYYPIIPSLTSNVSDYMGDDNPVSTIIPTAPEIVTVPSYSPA